MTQKDEMPVGSPVETSPGEPVLTATERRARRNITVLHWAIFLVCTTGILWLGRVLSQ